MAPILQDVGDGIIVRKCIAATHENFGNEPRLLRSSKPSVLGFHELVGTKHAPDIIHDLAT